MGIPLPVGVPSPGGVNIPPKIAEALTESDRLFLLAYAEGGYLWQVGVRWAQLRGGGYGNMGDSRRRHLAHAVAEKKLRQIRTKLEKLGDHETFYEILGIGMNKIARVYAEAMDATKVIPMAIKDGKDSQKVVEAGPYVDHPTRVEAATSAARLRGEIRRPANGNGEEAPKKPVTFIFNIGPTQVVTSG